MQESRAGEANPITELHRTRVEQQRLQLLREYEAAVAEHEAAVQATPQSLEPYLALCRCHVAARFYNAALETMERARQCCPPSPRLYDEYLTVLLDSGCAERAAEIAAEAVDRNPGSLLLRFRKHLLLPALYQNQAEVEFYRRHFQAGLETLSREVVLDSAEQRSAALQAISHFNPFYLGYQGGNDKELLSQYGLLIERIMGANHPQWMAPVPSTPVPLGEPIRVGFLSRSFWNHTVGHLFLGWFHKLRKDIVETRCYHIGDRNDHRTKEFRDAAGAFTQLPPDIASIASRIREDRLHVLIYLDIGMHPLPRILASLRLAPVQCATWGHPVTTGMRSVQYFLSSEAMEPPGAQAHYTEELILLPKLGISIPKPIIPKPLLSRDRTQFGLRTGAVVYYCGQSLFKYLPSYDFVLAKIAKRVPEAQFIFLSENDVLRQRLFSRLTAAFGQYGLDAGHHCVMLPAQDQFACWNLNVLSDVYLDSMSWSGGRTTLEAIACDLPVVTCPGQFMRGRHTSGILHTLGITETIANTEDEFVDLAVRLGNDIEWRKKVCARMKERESNLFDDSDCVEALENYFFKALQADPH